MWEQIDAAEICLSELVANVIQHVGTGTPVILRLAIEGAHLRIEVEDPDARSLPTLLEACGIAESGRGVALVDAVTEHRWGVILRGDSKVVWCELATGSPVGRSSPTGLRVKRAEAILDLYGAWRLPHHRGLARQGSPLSLAATEEVAVRVMADMLHWLRANGYDPDHVLDQAQTHFEAELAEVR
ncbi:ATP-binding protein [Streptomyces sp. NPDC051684]|uniref:ATP-binding protein n=1 Tax=Streptomyces sp. NPDC051684 TaxID=3365670 RepID=UPI0037B960E9